MPIYPIGGGTSLDFGLPANDPGIGLSLQGLKRIVDYPAHDMTITLEAGITLDVLAATLAKENQQLPIDLPNAHQATLGGVIATNTSGPRRFAYGTMRDYVIGIAAVDGRGMLFHGGGRVVKNVAGYDFCKLLTGSLGTLGVISQVTLRVKPIPECSRFLSCRLRLRDTAERLLAALVTSEATPAAVEMLAGPAWQRDSALESIEKDGLAHLVVALEGTEAEVNWMSSTLLDEWFRLGISGYRVPDDQTTGLWMRLAQFPAAGGAPLVIKAAVRPSGTVKFIRKLQELDPHCSIQAHAGNGVVIGRLSGFASHGISHTLISHLHPAATEQQGHVVVLSCAAPTS